MNDTTMTVVGNLYDARFTPSGAALANFTVASTPRNLRPPERGVEGG
jgi:single-strand DNA-binding protein